MLLALIAVSALVSCVSVPLEELPQPPPGSTRVVTLNTRMVTLPEEDPDERAAAIAAYLERTSPDIVLLQEAAVVDGYRVVTPCPLAEALVRRLPEYGWVRPIGAARLSGSNPILYRASRFMPTRQGVVWMSDTPNIPDSCSWGNALPRYAVWAVFYDHAESSRVFVMNVHLDHLSRRTNARAVDVIADTIRTEAGDLPVILGGDFNEPPLSPVRRSLEGELSCVLQGSRAPTHLAFPRLQIDTILHTDDVVLRRTWVDDEPVRGAIESDHAAVWAEFALDATE